MDKLEIDLQRTTSLNSLLCDTGAYNEDLIELEAQRKNEEARGRIVINEAPKRLMMQERARRFYLRKHC